MLRIHDKLKKELIALFDEKNIALEGNIVKMIDAEDDKEFQEYVTTCLEKDRESRKKRLEITRQVQIQNKELSALNEQNTQIMQELHQTLEDMESSKNHIELQNRELIAWKQDNERMSLELRDEMIKSESARIEAENAKKAAESDLDLLQKKTQTELIGKIVMIALYVIVGVGISTTMMYVFSMITNKDTQMIGSTWSNMFGILLTNAFSIIGTIMGVKYASEKKED